MREGYLKHNNQGRYEIPGVTYFTSGEPIEIFYDDMWITGRMEYSQKEMEYYFVNEEKGVYVYDLLGIKAREIN